MPGKRQLEELVNTSPSTPTLRRRGEGMRLSTEAPVEKDGVPQPTTNVAETQQRESAETHNRINAETQNSGNAELREAPKEKKVKPGPKRINRGYALREDLIKALKRVAIDDDRNLYEVMEEAFEQYLAQRQT